MPDRPLAHPRPRARLVQCQLETDHFAGLDAALARRGVACERVFPDQPPPRLGPETRCVVISDPFASMNALAFRQARRAGAAVVMVMDGVVEYRNTFLNPRSACVFADGDDSTANFLRPAPADLVVCSGETDRRILEAMGNRAVALGLPRLRGIGPVEREAAASRRVVVATANQPWFNDAERRRVLDSLRRVQQAAERLGVEVIWRLRGGLEDELGVRCDTRPLADVLRDAAGVLTTPSTLVIESMRAGCATGVIQPHPTPMWQACAWGWRHPDARGTIDDGALDALGDPARGLLRSIASEMERRTRWSDLLEDMIESMLRPGVHEMELQRSCLADQDASAGREPCSERLGELLASHCVGVERIEERRVSFVSPVRLPGPRASSSRPCVVSVVVCDDTPVGGVQTWSERLAREFARRDLGYDVRTLLVCVKPDAWRTSGTTVRTDELTDLCVIDPFEDHAQSIAHVREAIERIAGGVPAAVIPNYTDIAYAAAMQLRACGTRVIAVAHTDEAYYRDLASTYRAWDAGVGVSRECVRWMRETEAATRDVGPARPVEWIPCVAPVAPAPRPVPRDGPLRLAYIGRMVQVQKRIHDLLRVIDGLEERGVAYELHMVGDGVDLHAWRRELTRRRLRCGSVTVHGRREPAWVQQFLTTIDVSVLVSDFEGTSVSMLEAMGAGVVPAVTDVRSGVGEWVDDGLTGIVVPIGRPDIMAQRLAELANDRPRLAELGRRAWERARRDASVERMAEKYRGLFDAARQRPVLESPGDLGLRLIERWRWPKEWAEDAPAVESRVRAVLAEAGYSRIARDWPEPGCDAVLVRTDARPLTRVQAAQIDLWRACGLGVVITPHLRSAGPDDAMTPADARACDLVRGAVRERIARGATRIAIYGTGKHTRRLAALFDGSLPFVGFIDDAPPAWEFMFGLPIVPFSRTVQELRPDTVILSSDAWEARMWERAGVWRDAGVHVVPLYGTYEHAPRHKVIAA